MNKLELTFKQSKHNNHVVRTIFLKGYNIPENVSKNGIYFEFLNQKHMPQPHVLDGFMFCFIFVAMKDYDEFIINGPISSHALRNIRIFQEAWSCLVPKLYKICEIKPTKIISDRKMIFRKKEFAIGAFSGGIDATFMALRHSNKQLNNYSYPLKSLCIVQGFDIQHSNNYGFIKTIERIRPLINELSINLYLVKTNIREFELQNWEHSHSTQLSCILHQFSHLFGYGIIGSTAPYNHIFLPWGSTPMTDYLLSGGGFEIVHEGAGYSRTMKANLISKNKIARHILKVCWEGLEQHKNCGKCEKCVRTKLNFLAVGCKDPECFEEPFNISLLNNFKVTNQEQLNELISISEYAHLKGNKDKWLDKLDSVISKQKNILNKQS